VRQRNVEAARTLLQRVVSAGFDETNAARWFCAPLLTDTRYVRPSPEAPRRGLGGWIALWIAGEAVDAASLQPAPTAAERAALVALGLADDDGATLTPRTRILPWQGALVASPAAEAFDVSALNLAASLPSAASLWDVGCGAGLLSMVAARAGARVRGSDVDAALVGWASLNAGLNGVEIELVVADLLDGGGDRLFDVVVFNAPLVRAPLAVAGEDDAPRYSASPEGERLALRFLDGARARDRILVHAQLTPAIEDALVAHAARAAVTSVVFAHAPDGTPHALTEIRVAAAPSWRRVLVPLSPACPHLSRPIFDALARPRTLAGDVTPMVAPWLELRTRERFDGGRRALGVRFGGIAVDADDVALLDRLRGQPLDALGLSADARARLEVLVERGHVILR
jgi:SAM-dependent methyltransferase